MQAAAAAALLAAALAVVLASDAGTRVVTAADQPISRLFEDLRAGPLVDVAQVVVDVSSDGTFRVVAWTLLAVLLVFRRYQQLFASLTVLLVVPVAVALVSRGVGRMRPAGVEIVGSWEGYAHPSLPVADLVLVLALGCLVLAPAGRWRRRAVIAAAAAVVLVAVARLVTGVDHLSDVVAGACIGVSAPVLAIRLLTPEEAFPVTYRRGVRAHLDVGGRRGEAIRRAVERQLGLVVDDVEPFALAGSAGSTPLLLTTAGGPRFAKLYASVHLRSDRWYKLVRAIRYGRLEDERPFNSVRRLVQYEDYMLRVFRDAGVPTPAPVGIVEITPEREYLLVTELLPDAEELTTTTVTEAEIDEALATVRALWDAGLAHRDIKPSNVLRSGGHIWLIDLAFAEVRPSPWRQAVDLANMLLVLGLCAPAELVYGRARRLFSEDELAEAFAATRSVTIPSQLRRFLRERDDDLLDRFRELAPPREPVPIQRWTLRRVGLTLSVLAAALVAFGLVVGNLELAGLL